MTARYSILRQASLAQESPAAGGATASSDAIRHLRIVRYAGETACFLLRLDADGAETWDTFHETVEAALAQAEYEYRIRPDDGEITAETRA